MDAKLIQLVKDIRELDNKAGAYIDKVVYPINMFMLDNEYTTCQALIQQKLMKAVFGDMCEDICWFLYEWRPGFTIDVPGFDTFTINTEEDYYKYLETQ